MSELMQRSQLVQGAVLAASESNAFQHAAELVNAHPVPSLMAVTGACAMVGAAMEYRSLTRIDRNRDSLTAIWGQVAGENAPKARQKIPRALISLAAVGGGLVGATNASLWINFDKPVVTPSTLQVVVDRSGATMLENEMPALSVSSVVGGIETQLIHSDAEALVASEGLVEPKSLSEAILTTPIGHAPMAEAFQTAVGNAQLDRSAALSGEEVPFTGVAIVTNGNDFSGLVSEAQLGTAATPLFIFDVSGDGEYANKFKELAELTGGNYFDAESFSTEDGLKEDLNVVAEKLDATPRKAKQEGNGVGRMIVGALSLAAAIRWKMTRPKLTTTFNTALPRARDLTVRNTKTTHRFINRLPLIGKRVRR